MKLKNILFAFVIDLITIQQTLAGKQLNHCTSNTATEQAVVYAGWPFRLNCDNLTTNKSIETMCYVSTAAGFHHLANESITLRGNESHVIFTVTKFASESDCVSRNISIEVKSVSNSSCYDEVIMAVSKSVDVVKRSVWEFERMQLDCIPEGSSMVYLPTEFNITWKRSQRNIDLQYHKSNACNIYRDPKTIISNKPSPMVIKRSTFDSPGVYTCEISYKGQTAYVVHYSICIQNKQKYEQPKLTCVGEQNITKGATTIIECSLIATNGPFTQNDIEIIWQKSDVESKQDNSRKMCSFQNLTQRSINSRYSCGISKLARNPVMCYDYVPHDMYYNKSKIFLKIEDGKRGDDGNYMLRVRYKTDWTRGSVRLRYDPVKELMLVVMIISTVAGVMLGTALLVSLIWYYRIQLKLRIRRHFGKYDKGGNSLSDENTKKIIRNIRTRMEKMNYNFYDHYENFKPGYSVETFLANLQQCHRMIIIFTDNFIHDSKSRFFAHQGHLNMQKNQLKLIIITTPGVKKELRSCTNVESISEKVVKDLNEAVKANHKIQWKSKLSEERFQDSVEQALPYLRRHCEN